MPSHRVNRDAVTRAEKLADAGTFDDDTEWSDAAPSAEDGNAEIEKHGCEGYGAWHLAIDPDASEETPGRYAFPYGDCRKDDRAALIHAAQRAAQNGTTPWGRPPTASCDASTESATRNGSAHPARRDATAVGSGA